MRVRDLLRQELHRHRQSRIRSNRREFSDVRGREESRDPLLPRRGEGHRLLPLRQGGEAPDLRLHPRYLGGRRDPRKVRAEPRIRTGAPRFLLPPWDSEGAHRGRRPGRPRRPKVVRISRILAHRVPRPIEGGKQHG